MWYQVTEKFKLKELKPVDYSNTKVLMIDEIDSFKSEEARSKGKKSKIVAYSSDSSGDIALLDDFQEFTENEASVMVSQRDS